MSVRITAAGAVVLTLLCFMTAPVRACDDRFIKKCETESAQAAQPEVAAPVVVRRKSTPRVRAAAPETPEVTRTRAPRFGTPPEQPELTLASDESRPVALEPESPMTRRFRGFIDPQSIAVNSFEALRKPRLDPAHLTPAPALPANDMNAVAQVDEIAAAAETVATVIAAKPDLALATAPASLPAAIPAEASVVNWAPPSEDKPNRFPVHQLVLALCGALGAASALRFIVGA